MNPSGDVTQLLQEIQAGSKSAEDRLLEVVYPKLRQIAKRYLRNERLGHTLQPTALVHEAYLQLAGRSDGNWQNRTHFFAVAAILMRRILVDYARNKKAKKRDGARQRVELSDDLAISEDRLEQILQVDEALVRLAQLDERQCKVVELRFFGGLTEEEVAEVLGVAPRTVKRDWNVAKAWLYDQLDTSPDNGQP